MNIMLAIGKTIMRHSSVAVLLLAFCAVGIAATQGEQRQKAPRFEKSNGGSLEIPVFVPHPDDGADLAYEPRWARGSYFEDPFGGLDKTRLDRHYGPGFYLILNALHTEALAAFNNGTEPPDCLDWRGITRRGHDPAFPEPPSSVHEIVNRAALVATGTVTAIETGFSCVNPGSMLLVQLDSFASRAGYEPREELLVWWPLGEVHIGRATLCAFIHNFPLPPSIGDKIMLFPEYELYGADDPWINIQGDASGGAAVYANAGGLVVPGPLSRSVPNVVRARSFATLDSAFRAAVSRSALQR